MTREEKMNEALRTMDFYELAKLTMEAQPMKINVKQIKSEEQLELCCNRFFTQAQLQEIARA